MKDEKRNNYNSIANFADMFNRTTSDIVILVIHMFFVLFVKENEK